MSVHEKLVDFFKSNDTYISGEKISEQLGISRTAVWKQIKKLQALGYEFDAITNQGYKLIYAPHRLDVDAVMKHFEHRQLGHTIHYYDDIQSTQIAAKQLAEDGAAHGTIVIAEQQLAGKGRMGRKWHSPPGKGIWMSIILRPNIAMHLAPQLTLIAAVALADAIIDTTALQVSIKWPNDLLYNGKKLSGILLESTAEDQRIKYVIAGIGIDVNLSANDYDDELSVKATSLRIEKGQVIEREALLQEAISKLEKYLELYEQHGFKPIAERWEQLAISIGKRISIQTAQEQFFAVPLRLTERGSIVVKRDDGTEQEIYSAEMGEVNE